MTPTPDRPARTAAEIEALEEGCYYLSPHGVVLYRCGSFWRVGNRPGDNVTSERIAEGGGIVDRLIPQSEARAELEEARELLRRVNVAAESLAALVDEGPCRFDHHGYCQEHGLCEREEGGRCQMGEALDFVVSGVVSAFLTHQGDTDE